MRPAFLGLLAVCTFITIGCGQSSRPEASASGDGIAPVQLTDANFQDEVFQSDVPVLVDMWAPWCQPCIAMKPTIRDLAKDLQGVAKVGELNIEENQFIKQKYNIDKYPMLLIFVDQQEVQRLVGTKSKEELANALRAYTGDRWEKQK